MNGLQRAASIMGKMGKGKRKTLTNEERLRRRLRMVEVQRLRWIGNKNEFGKKQSDC